MESQKQHDEIIGRLKIAKERSELAFNNAKTSHLLSVTICIFIAPWFPILKSCPDLWVIHVIVFLVYGIGFVAIWRDLSYRLDPHFREYVAISVEIDCIHDELREFEKGRKNPDEMA